jgi:hypothetical protein
MSLVDPDHATVAVDDIWKAFELRIPDRTALAKAAAWHKSEIDTIDAYQGKRARYTFPTLSQLRSTFNRTLDIVSIRFGTYELAERCPTIALSRRER